MADEKFKITIERTRTVERTVGKEWAQIGQLENGKPEYGYTPQVQKTILESDDIYTQIVETLDLKAVIDAVNKPG